LRTALSLILALLAGLLAAFALAGSRLDALVHTPGPLQQIAGPVSEDPELRQAVPAAIGSVAEGQLQERLPDRLPGFLQDRAVNLVQDAADGMVTDDRFPAAWAAVLEQSRVDWLDRLDRIEAGSSEVEATAHLQLAPLAELGVDRLAESVESFPGGDSVAKFIRENAEAAFAELEESPNGQDSRAAGDGDEASPLVVEVPVPDPDRVSAQQLSTAVGLLPQWPWLAAGAAGAALLALLVAPRGRKWTVLVGVGAAVLMAGLAGWWSLNHVVIPEVSGLALVAAESLFEGLRDYAMPHAVLLMGGGALLLALGVVAAMFSRRGSSPRW
jgi:hypothetical protein